MGKEARSHENKVNGMEMGEIESPNWSFWKADSLKNWSSRMRSGEKTNVKKKGFQLNCRYLWTNFKVSTKKHVKFLCHQFYTLPDEYKRNQISGEVTMCMDEKTRRFKNVSFLQTKIWIRCNTNKISTRFFMELYKSVLKVIQWVNCKKTHKIFEKEVN